MAAVALALPNTIEKLVQNAEARASVAAAVAGHPAVLEPKYDGWRTIWKVEHVRWDEDENGDPIEVRKARFFTRSGQDLTGRMPAVEAMIAAALPSGSILDGEVVEMENVDGVLVPRWGGAQSVLGSGVAKAALASGSLTLVLFDLLVHGEVDARKAPFWQRREALEAVYAQAGWDPMKVMLSEHLEPTEAMHGALVDAGYEGSMVKWLDAPYKSGARGHGWWKLKATDDVDAIVIGYKEGDGSWTGLIGSIIFGAYTADGLLVPLGSCSGMTFQERTTISKNRDAYLGRVFSFRHMGRQAPTVEHPHGAFRHPQFKTWRPDKGPEAVMVP